MERARLPNGFGQISFVKEKRLRCPWRAMVSVGRDKSGKYKRKIVGYFASYEEAYAALEEYHKMTFKDLYEAWSKYNLKDMPYPKAIEAAFNRLGHLRSMKLEDITALDIKLAKDAKMGPSALENIARLLLCLSTFAAEHNLPLRKEVILICQEKSE